MAMLLVRKKRAPAALRLSLFVSILVSIWFSVNGWGGPSELARLFAEKHYKESVVKPAAGILKHPYLVPGGPYDQLFDWDMYFMSVALSYDHVSAPTEGSVEDFLEFVDQDNDPGYVSRLITPGGFGALPEMCKPFLAQAALRALRTSGKSDWLAPYYERLTHTLEYWEAARRASDGLFIWYNGLESGTDNSTAVIDSPAITTEGVDLQSYLVREYQALAVLGRKLKRAQPEVDRFESRAKAIARNVQTKMWSEKDGLFLNIDSRTGKRVRTKAWTSFTPLWAGIATPAQAKRMIKDHLLNPAEFWARYGVRTLSADEPGYDPGGGYWRGPVWVVSNYLAMQGLLHYGYKKEARELAQKTVDLLLNDFKKSGNMNECYHPDSGAPTASGNFVSWNLLAEHMIEEAESGTDPTALGN